jgi:hypothetical protein
LWALEDRVWLRTPQIVGAAPGAVVAIPMTIYANHPGITGDLTVTVQLDSALSDAAPADLQLIFRDMGYLDVQTQFIRVRLPASAAYGDSATLSATLSGALDPVSPITISVQAAHQIFIPQIRR